MAFLAKKVPKIFPSKSRKGNEHLLASNPCHGKAKGAFLFRKLAREKEFHQEDPAPQTPKEAEDSRLQSPAVDCNGNGNDSHSNDSTLESSPTLTPRETMDPVAIVLPDLPNLAVPEKNTCNNASSNNASSNNASSNCNAVPASLALALAPRSIPAHDDLPPPVALVSVPSDFSFPPSMNASPARCLTHAPPRSGEWDDATIESQLEQPDSSDDQDRDHDCDQDPSSSHHDQDVAAAQASAIMKPWIERAARLALLQKMANEKLAAGENNLQTGTKTESFANLVLLQRTRTRQATGRATGRATRPAKVRNANHRTLLASLEQEQNPTKAEASQHKTIPMNNNNNNNNNNMTDLECAPRVVKWHMVRK